MRPSCSFTVHVKGAVEQTNDLLAAVNALNVGNGVKNGLVVKLTVVLTKLADYNSAAASLPSDAPNATAGFRITVAVRRCWPA